MIVLKSYGYGGNGQTLVATIEYDYPEGSGTTYTFTPQAPVSQVIGMTQAEIVTWIVNQVASRRGQMEQQQVDTLLGPILNTDLEAP